MRHRLLAAAFLLSASTLAAQSTGTPVYHGPYRGFSNYEFGGNVSDAGNIAFEGFYGFSQAGSKWDFALRGGVMDTGPGGKAALLAGVDARIRVIDQTEDFPLDGAFIGGVGTSLVSGGSSLYVPFGLSLGRRLTFEGSKISVVPFAQPVIIARFGKGNADSHVLVSMGLGADLRINQRFEIRGAIGVGDIENFSLGISFTR